MPARTARRSHQAATVAPAAFAPQRSAASARELVLFELERGRVAVEAAIQGLGSAGAGRPVAPGKWSPREIVLLLAARDRQCLHELDAIWRGTPATWAHLEAAALAAVNEAQLAASRAPAWHDAVRRLELTREELLAALRALPEAPAENWGAAHPFGAALLALAPHDRWHAEQIKAARIAG